MNDDVSSDPGLSRQGLLGGFKAVRGHTQALIEGLGAEDLQLQSMPDASPVKWHLAHTTWFFEAMVLQAHAAGYRPCDERYFYLFNSYYEALGPRHPRPQRGLLSRPSVAQVLAYRRHVDDAVTAFIEQADALAWGQAAPLLRLGLHHEQQHQELILTDLKHAFSLNALLPAWRPAGPPAACSSRASALQWQRHGQAPDGGLVEVGHAGDGFTGSAAAPGFAFDNETPRHRHWLAPFELASRPLTCGEYLAFVRDGGYRQPRWWLSDGWAQVRVEGWCAPLYWLGDDGAPLAEGAQPAQVFTLHGAQPFDADAPVCHLSAYEAAACAAWAGARLPTEHELELAHAAERPAAPRHDLGWMQPLQTVAGTGTGEVWQWTQSAYAPYPGFRPWDGPAAEYNGKFMVNQLVLRGGSCATPPGHWRPSYRNFFPPAARWQFSGLRLARDIR